MELRSGKKAAPIPRPRARVTKAKRAKVLANDILTTSPDMKLRSGNKPAPTPRPKAKVTKGGRAKMSTPRGQSSTRPPALPSLPPTTSSSSASKPVANPTSTAKVSNNKTTDVSEQPGPGSTRRPRLPSSPSSPSSSSSESPSPAPSPPPPRSLDPKVLEASTQHNAWSPLLRLPLEIKRMIYDCVIGYPTLHINRNATGDSNFYNGVCKAIAHDASNEEMAHDQGMTLDEWREYMDGMTLQQREYYDTRDTRRWANRHHSCYAADRQKQPYTHYLAPAPKHSWLLPSLLFICRQVYAEARLIPYANTTFDFVSENLFKGWMQILSPNQTAAVRNIKLGGLGASRWSVAGWIEALRFMLGRLQGIKNIEIQFDKNYHNVEYFVSPFRHLDLGSATLVVRQTGDVVGRFTETQQGEPGRSITASDLWG